MREEIERLVDFEGRAPGSDAERRAAEHLIERLREMGREAEAEGIDTWPNWPMTYALHVAVAVVGSVVSVTIPVLGAALVLLATVLTFLDANGIAFTTRKLFGRRASQNVVSREEGDKGGTIVLVAHYDSGRSGLAFNRRIQERRATFNKLIKRQIGPLQPLFYSMVAVLVCTLLRVPGIENTILTVIQFLFTVLLIVALPFLIDTALAPAVPGANDNASGVATALRLADRFGGELEHFDIHVLFTGSEEALAQGMRSYLKKHTLDLDVERFVFLNLDEVGIGTVRYTSREGLLLPVASHSQLVEMCDEIVEDMEEEREEEEDSDDDEDDIDPALKHDDDDDEEDRPGPRKLVSRNVSDAFAARSAGYPAITITCKGRLDYTPTHHQVSDLPDRIDDEALDRAYDFCAELIERIDKTVGPDMARPEETLLKESD
ncbi:MAG TPA: M28 family peptidase [Thermoleophilaceae bacterium]|nr:M28 family peptidase [Thermoleophilaceae bacterium]